jgi:hypothetical protein
MSQSFSKNASDAQNRKAKWIETWCDKEPINVGVLSVQYVKNGHVLNWRMLSYGYQISLT